MAAVKKIANVTTECVACGCCVKICPKKAIAIYKGICAIVNSNTCVGCGKCVKACPAAIISLRKVTLCEEAVV